MSWAYGIIALGLVGMVVEIFRSHARRLQEIQDHLQKVEASIARHADALLELEQTGDAIRHRLGPLQEEKESLKDEVALRRQELEELEERYARRHIGGKPLEL